MAPLDPELAKIGKQRGMEIWRIKNFALEKLPKEQFGNFYIGDSYILLYTKDPGEWNVHFWLGSETTQDCSGVGQVRGPDKEAEKMADTMPVDINTYYLMSARYYNEEVLFFMAVQALPLLTKDEKGAAAIKTVEIDDALGGNPVQYREVQGHESSLFLSYFKDGIKYLQGGIASGFNHVTDPYDSWKPRLFQCKGKRNVRCTQVPCKRESLNLGDVFILDCGLTLYVWMPPDSGRLERIKGMDQARNIRDQERGGKPQIHVLDSDWESNNEFWNVLGGKGKVKPAQEGGEDEDYWQTNNKQVSLWRVSDESGKMDVKMVSQGNFKYSQLESKDAFILDAYNGGIYVWIGKKCSADERKKSMLYALKYIELQKRPKDTQVVRVMEGAEPAAFTQWASSWEGPKKAPPFVPRLYQCSDNNGKLSIEEIYNYTQEDLDGDDVMIVDALNVIYIWIGAKASEREKKVADGVATKYLEGDSHPRPAGTQCVKMKQGQETPKFKEIFGKWDDHISGERTVEKMKKRL